MTSEPPTDDSKKTPRFIFRGKHLRNEQFICVSVAREDDDEYGQPLGTIYHRSLDVWVWCETYPSNLLSYVKRLQFPSQELAASFLYALHSQSEKHRQENPLPDQIAAYFEVRARELLRRKQELLSELRTLLHERLTLREFAEKFNLNKVEYSTEDTDEAASLRELLEFKVDIPEEGEVSFFSEAAIYHLIGKDAARTVLALMSKVGHSVAPDITEELL